MRFVFFGTPEAAVPPLRAFVDAGHEPVLVVSRADRRRRRRGDPEPSPVKAAALELGIPVTDNIDDIFAVEADLAVVVAFGQILKDPVLETMPMVNLHFSLLPRWRGAAPVERAILAGDTTTGVCVMEMVTELDAGAVYAQAEVPIGAEQTAAELRVELVRVGSKLLVDTFEAGLEEALADPKPQAGEVVYAHKIHSDDLHLDWSRPALELHRIVRVGGAWTKWKGDRFKIHQVHHVDRDEVTADTAPGELHDLVVTCGDGAGLRLVSVQPAGKPKMDADAWSNGAQPAPGATLGPAE